LTGITPPTLPSYGLVSISQVELKIALGQNVSGLGEKFIEGGDPIIYCDESLDPDDPDTFKCMLTNTRLTFLDENGNHWGIYFGPGSRTDGSWGGRRFFTNTQADPVQVVRTNPSKTDENPKNWTVQSQGNPGCFWYRGSKKNAPWVFAGVFLVPWSCTVNSLE